MDPWLDNPDPNVVLSAMQNTFTAHYNGNRQPFGLYSHPSASIVGCLTDTAVHLAANCASFSTRSH